MNTRNLRFRSNRVRDILSLFHEELDSMYGSGEVNAFVEMLAEAYLGWTRVQLLSSRDATVDQSDLLRFHWALEDLKRQRPIQHIIGYVDFGGCRIEVGPEVLIPRPETEEMVAALAASRTGTSGRALDLCTGSGCIAIALKKALEEWQLTAVDLSEAALAVARRNATANHTEVDFIQADVLDKSFQPGTAHYDLIVSNPPYVRMSEKTLMQRNVLDYEPQEALFVPDNDPMLFYRALAALAARCLADGGQLAVEINEALPEATAEELRRQGFTTELHFDFRGKPRWLSAKRIPQQ